jgi:hypothetical protein
MLKPLLELASVWIRESSFPSKLKKNQYWNQVMKKGQKKMETIIAKLLLSQLLQRFTAKQLISFFRQAQHM